MNKLCVSSGWCAFEEPRNNSMGSHAQYAPDYLNNVWRKQIEKYIKPDKYFIYGSKCPVDFTFHEWDHIYVESANDVRTQSHHIDWSASVVLPAQYALINKMDLLFIEQDCLVRGLDKALEFAQGKKICYGDDNFSYAQGWAEHSLLWVSYDYLKTFIHKMNDVWDTIQVLEVFFYRAFKEDFTPWPFGFGRKRPIDFSQPILYAQQLKDFEINEFIKSK
jgi:hypothetical protein